MAEGNYVVFKSRLMVVTGSMEIHFPPVTSSKLICYSQFGTLAYMLTSTEKELIRQTKTSDKHKKCNNEPNKSMKRQHNNCACHKSTAN
jgi:hypothetical protein